LRKAGHVKRMGPVYESDFSFGKKELVDSPLAAKCGCRSISKNLSVIDTMRYP
jgi:hypothetical protein